MTQLVLRVVNRLLETRGDHTLHDSNPLQRLQRDIQAATHSFSLKWDETAEQYGRVALGLDPLPRLPGCSASCHLVRVAKSVLRWTN